MHRKFTNLMILTTLAAAAVACDGVDARDQVNAANPNDESDDIALESIAEFVDQERWEDGLEEILDLVCDGEDCQWAWSELNQVGLGELTDQLPEAPESRVNGGDAVANVWKAKDDPPTAGGKLVKINSIRCIETQDVGDDEPSLFMNGSSVWSPSNIKNGVTYNVGSTWKSTPTEIELFERDVSINDYIDSFTVGSAHADGPWSRTLKGAGGEYKVYYCVRYC